MLLIKPSNSKLMSKNNESKVSLIFEDNFSYPDAPFSPSDSFPEFDELPYSIKKSDEENIVYRQVRDVLISLDLDSENIGTKNWKPFRDLLKKGQHVVLKPNFVKGKHYLGEIGVVSMITHASLMRPIIDYALLSTDGDCKITICDVPLQSSSWKHIVKWSGTTDLVNFYKNKGIEVNLVDLRREISELNEQLVIHKREYKDRDPEGYAAVDLAEKSSLMPVIEHYKRFMITDYDKGTVSEHHNKTRNEYCVGKTILSADLFINMPKLKTHRKSGLTVAMKNLIGINGDKRWIAHHREKSVKFGGDEFPRYNFRNWFEFRLFAFLKRYDPVGVWIATMIRKVHSALYKAIRSRQKASEENNSQTLVNPGDEITENSVGRWHTSYEEFIKKYPFSNYAVYKELNPTQFRPMEGSWYGNDTIWRTVCDLNHIIFYADKKGIVQDEVQRKYLCIVDGVLAGDGEGPMKHQPKDAGVIIGGFHPITIDFVSAHIMGLDYKKMPSIYKIFENKYVNFTGLTPENIDVRSNRDYENTNMLFKPTRGWMGHIER